MSLVIYTERLDVLQGIILLCQVISINYLEYYNTIVKNLKKLNKTINNQLTESLRFKKILIGKNRFLTHLYLFVFDQAKTSPSLYPFFTKLRS